MVQRLCGICPVSHHLAASKAIDMIVGATAADADRREDAPAAALRPDPAVARAALLPPRLARPAVRLRRRGRQAQHRRPSPPSNPEVAKQGVLLRKYGQEVIRVTVGQARARHLRGAGRRQQAPHAPRSATTCSATSTAPSQWSQRGGRHSSSGSTPSARTSTTASATSTRRTSAWSAATARSTSTTAACARGTRTARCIFDHVDYASYCDYIFEEPKPWSYMKFPFLRALGPEDGWYRVGPLARINNCDFIPTPLAEAERVAFRDFDTAARRHAQPRATTGRA